MKVRNIFLFIVCWGIFFSLAYFVKGNDENIWFLLGGSFALSLFVIIVTRLIDAMAHKSSKKIEADRIDYKISMLAEGHPFVEDYMTIVQSGDSSLIVKNDLSYIVEEERGTLNYEKLLNDLLTDFSQFVKTCNAMREYAADKNIAFQIVAYKQEGEEDLEEILASK